METTLRLLRFIWGSLVSSIFVYILVGERVAHPSPPAIVVLEAIAFLCIANVGVIFFLRRMMVDKAAASLGSRPDEPSALARWRGGSIITLALCESVALFGFVARMLGFSLAQVGMFYLSALILMIFLLPRRPEQALGA
jgi:hypothetical protein